MVALAGPREDAISKVLDQVKDAQDEAEDATGACRRALRDLEDLSDALSSLQKDATDKGLSSFWECKRARNAPQAICMQDN